MGGVFTCTGLECKVKLGDGFVQIAKFGCVVVRVDLFVRFVEVPVPHSTTPHHSTRSANWCAYTPNTKN